MLLISRTTPVIDVSCKINPKSNEIFSNLIHHNNSHTDVMPITNKYRKNEQPCPIPDPRFLLPNFQIRPGQKRDAFSYPLLGD